jgi:hypothetical protein
MCRLPGSKMATIKTGLMLTMRHGANLRACVVAAALVAGFFGAHDAEAATRTWRGTGSNLWSTNANWLTSTPPNPLGGDDLVVDRTGANSCFVNDLAPTSISVSSVHIIQNNSLTLNNNGLAPTFDFIVNGDFTTDAVTSGSTNGTLVMQSNTNSSLTVYGDFINDGIVNQSNTTTGTIFLAGAGQNWQATGAGSSNWREVSVTGSYTLTNNLTIVNNAASIFDVSGSLAVDPGVTVDTRTLTGGGSVTFGSGATFVWRSTSAVPNLTYENLTLQAATSLSANLVVNGDLNIAGGNLTTNGYDITIGGNLSVGTNRVITAAAGAGGSTSITVGGDITGANGNSRIECSTNDCTFAYTGTGTVTFNMPRTSGTFTGFTTWTVPSGKTVNVTGTAFALGTSALPVNGVVAGTLDVGHSATSMTWQGSWSISGTVTLSSGTILTLTHSTGNLSLSGTGSLNLGGLTTYLLERNITMTGTSAVTSVSVFRTNSGSFTQQLSIASTANFAPTTYRVQSAQTAQLVGATRIGGAVDIIGTLQLNGFVLTARDASNVYQSVTIGAGGNGTVNGTVSGSGLDVGSLTVTDGADSLTTAANASAPSIAVNGALSNAGTINFTSSNALLTVSGDFTSSATFNAGTSTVTLTGTGTIGTAVTLTLNNLTINSGTRTVTTTTTLTVGGNLTTNASGILSFGAANVNVAGDLANSGTMSGSGFLTMNGIGAQLISGGTYNTLRINNTGSSDVTATGNLVITTSLTILDGQLNLGTSRTHSTPSITQSASTTLTVGAGTSLTCTGAVSSSGSVVVGAGAAMRLATGINHGFTNLTSTGSGSSRPIFSRVGGAGGSGFWRMTVTGQVNIEQTDFVYLADGGGGTAGVNLTGSPAPLASGPGFNYVGFWRGQSGLTYLRVGNASFGGLTFTGLSFRSPSAPNAGPTQGPTSFNPTAGGVDRTVNNAAGSAITFDAYATGVGFFYGAGTTEGSTVNWGTSDADMASLGAVGTLATGLVNVTWTTASEKDNLGFRVSRALSPLGPWQVVSDLVPGLGTTPVGMTYNAIDSLGAVGAETRATVLAGGALFYKVTDISFTGQEKDHGPVAVIWTDAPTAAEQQDTGSSHKPANLAGAMAAAGATGSVAATGSTTGLNLGTAGNGIGGVTASCPSTLAATARVFEVTPNGGLGSGKARALRIDPATLVSAGLSQVVAETLGQRDVQVYDADMQPVDYRVAAVAGATALVIETATEGKLYVHVGELVSQAEAAGSTETTHLTAQAVTAAAAKTSTGWAAQGVATASAPTKVRLPVAGHAGKPGAMQVSLKLGAAGVAGEKLVVSFGGRTLATVVATEGESEITAQLDLSNGAALTDGTLTVAVQGAGQTVSNAAVWVDGVTVRAPAGVVAAERNIADATTVSDVRPVLASSVCR